MDFVRAKKQLGQHFLGDKNIARKIVASISSSPPFSLLEIGPGTGVLTQFLVKQYPDFQVVEIDNESVQYLQQHIPELVIIHQDILKLSFSEYTNRNLVLIGNLPYNISSQVFFKVLEERSLVSECVFMIQKEVAERICSTSGKKIYGILSVLIQAYYKTEYLFSVKPGVFIPPPKVMSAVIRLRRNEVTEYPCDEKLLFKIVKSGFNYRRKTLRNALKSIIPVGFNHSFLNNRAEQLEVANFVELTQAISMFKD